MRGYLQLSLLLNTPTDVLIPLISLGIDSNKYRGGVEGFLEDRTQVEGEEGKEADQRS